MPGGAPPPPLAGRKRRPTGLRGASPSGGPPPPLREKGARPNGASPQLLRTSEPGPQSQSFSRGYGSVLPTSLTYVLLSARGCSPRRPAAVIGTTERDGDPLPQVFKVRRGRPGRPGSRDALPGAQPYLRSIRFRGRALRRGGERTLPGTPAGVPEFVRVAAFRPLLGSGISTRFPFGAGAASAPPESRPSEGGRAPSAAGFPRPLGSTDPRPTAVRAEPFSASALRGLV